MTLAPFTHDEKVRRNAFALLRKFREQLRIDIPALSLPDLSMGMSNDFVEAVLEGATMLRIGTGLFGARK